MIPGADTSPAQRTERPVWQLAFYAPLEETKGIKIFCDAVEQLPRAVLDRPGFEVSAARILYPCEFPGASPVGTQMITSTAPLDCEDDSPLAEVENVSCLRCRCTSLGKRQRLIRG